MDTTKDETVVPRVLIVDDDSTIRLLMQHTLKKAGFELAQAKDGETALELFRQEIPDIILLDVMMPGLDGFATCRELRKLPGGQRVPILMVTGLDDVDSINQAYEAGATDFITKPITYPLLGHRVRYVLRANQAMERVGKSEARLAHAQAIAHLGNWGWDVARNKLYCSDEVFRIIGIPQDSFDHRFESFMAIVHPDERAQVETVIAEALRSGRSYGLDHRITRPDSMVRIIHHLGEATLDANGQAVSLNGIWQDITERKLAEEELRQYRNHLEDLVAQRTAELTEANSQLQDAKELAEQANGLKDKFISLVAHDLRSPLAGIITALDYMYTDEDDPLNDDHRDIVKRLLNVGKSLVTMIEDVLNVGRLKSGKITPKRQPIDVCEVVQNVMQNLDYLAGQKGVILCNEVPPGTRFDADLALYGEVVQNLASNGIKFCNKGDAIRFHLVEGHPHVLAVTDTGIGIPAEAQPKLFRIEEKTSTPGTSGEQGTGFGLPFSQDIMQAHGGSLTVESEVGKGTTFFINLPDALSSH